MADDEILHSWKEISAYLKCDKKTCARWAADCGLPVRRFDPDSTRSRVYALKAELDQWLATRGKPEAEPDKAGRAAGRRFQAFALAAGIVTLVLPAAWFLGNTLFSKRTPPIVAVRPTAHDGVPSEFDYVAEGVTQQIVSNLEFGNRALVRQIPAQGPASGAEPGDLPDADYLIESRLKPEQDLLRLEIVLKSARDGRPIFAPSAKIGLPRNMGDYVDYVCAEFVRRMPGAESFAAPPAYRGGPSVRDPIEARNGDVPATGLEREDPWSLYYQSIHFSKFGTPEGRQQARVCLERALALDPNFGLAHFGLALCYANYINFEGRREIRWLELGESHAEKGRILAPNYPAYYAVKIRLALLRELVFGQDTSRQYFALVKEGLALFPADADINSMGGHCYFRRFEKEGRTEDLDTAQEMKTRAYWGNFADLGNLTYAEILMLKRDFVSAQIVCRRLENLSSDQSSIKYREAEILYYSGDLDGADKIFTLCDTPQDLLIGAMYYRAMIAARRGDRSRAFALLEQIHELKPVRDIFYAEPLREASVYAGLGEPEKALPLIRETFQAAAQMGPYVLRTYLEIDPNFDGLRSRIVLPPVLARK